MKGRFTLLSLAMFCTSLYSCAQTENKVTPKQFIAYKTSQEMVIDGQGDEEAWKKAEWSDTFVDIEGIKKPKYDTKVKMLWDDKYYYILAKMEEPHVWATLKQRDTIIFYNNDFEVFIDPDGDTQNYYELEINALNTAWDLFINKPYREQNVVLNDWNLTGLKSAVAIDGTLNNPKDIDKGWMLEIAIPWKAYRTSYFHQNVPKDNFWKVNFSRVNWQHDITNGKYTRKKDANGKFLPEYNWVWSPMGVINMHEPEKWGYVYFSSKEVGTKDNFAIPQDDKVKWELYTLYRAQKNYYKTHQTWAKTMDDILKDEVLLAGQKLSFQLENHTSGYNIITISPFSKKTYIIKEDGQVFEK